MRDHGEPGIEKGSAKWDEGHHQESLGRHGLALPLRGLGTDNPPCPPRALRARPSPRRSNHIPQDLLRLNRLNRGTAQSTLTDGTPTRARRWRDAIDCLARSRAPRQDPETAAKPAPAGCADAFRTVPMRPVRVLRPSKTLFEMPMAQIGASPGASGITMPVHACREAPYLREFVPEFPRRLSGHQGLHTKCKSRTAVCTRSTISCRQNHAVPHDLGGIGRPLTSAWLLLTFTADGRHEYTATLALGRTVLARCHTLTTARLWRSENKTGGSKCQQSAFLA